MSHPSPSPDEKEVRFEFGKNWQSYAQGIDEEKISEAVRRMRSLCDPLELSGKTFLDIGCGSGLHSLAAVRLGVTAVRSVDLDEHSVATTRAVLGRYSPGAGCLVEHRSVFDLTPERDGQYDVVYSWGVLHHTGAMNQAILQACRMVKPGGALVLALYGKTRWCGVWTRIKRWYVQADDEAKARAERWYVRLFGVYMLLRGKLLSTHIRNYQKKRGMDFYHDVKDWMGGYPYESILPTELDALVLPQGFRLVKAKVKRRSGLFGSGCDEFVYEKRDG
jgi:2-polyprenyl-6-hydroxyphenyl methylase/3-demethylubiquinone-9 3-methyltransferase